MNALHIVLEFNRPAVALVCCQCLLIAAFGTCILAQEHMNSDLTVYINVAWPIIRYVSDLGLHMKVIHR